MSTQLLCTFVKNKNVIKWLNDVSKHYNFFNNRVYILDIGSKFEVVCSYNIVIDRRDYITHVPNTISVHRRNETNTIYTINALNEIVKNMNNGIVDKNVDINWDLYTNKLLVTNNDGLKQFNTEIKEIINI